MDKIYESRQYLVFILNNLMEIITYDKNYEFISNLFMDFICNESDIEIMKIILNKGISFKDFNNIYEENIYDGTPLIEILNISDSNFFNYCIDNSLLDSIDNIKEEVDILFLGNGSSHLKNRYDIIREMFKNKKFQNKIGMSYDELCNTYLTKQ